MALRDAAVIVVLCIAAAVALNAVRDSGLPLVQREAYQTLVPCPETMGEVAALEELVALHDPRVLVIDARSGEAFGRWHVVNAINVPFDYLEPTDPAIIRRIASSGARAVVVYGDGKSPDSGEQLARELAGKGIRHIRFVDGGATTVSALAPRGTAR